MRKSELAKSIKEEIFEILSEATIETSPENLEKVKSTADDDDIIKVTESLNPEILRALDRFIKAMAKRYGYSERDAVFAIKAAMKQRDSDGVNENEDMDDVEMDKKASSAAKKGDSVSKIANKLGETTKEMKSVVKKYKDSKEPEKGKLLSRLKELTKIKKELEGLL
jgi:hypothetical protein|tara:strand:+ start:1297 stop:1797 length:501 start_codon:yes stop_codon:yes gene_type:complete